MFSFNSYPALMVKPFSWVLPHMVYFVGSGIWRTPERSSRQPVKYMEAEETWYVSQLQMTSLLKWPHSQVLLNLDDWLLPASCRSNSFLFIRQNKNKAMAAAAAAQWRFNHDDDGSSDDVESRWHFKNLPCDFWVTQMAIYRLMLIRIHSWAKCSSISVGGAGLLAGFLQWDL